MEHGSNVIQMTVKPKQVTEQFAGQRLTITFKPDAPEGERWGWMIRVTRHYDFFGSASTENRARIAARKRIEDMCGPAPASTKRKV